MMMSLFRRLFRPRPTPPPNPIAEAWCDFAEAMRLDRAAELEYRAIYYAGACGFRRALVRMARDGIEPYDAVVAISRELDRFVESGQPRPEPVELRMPAVEPARIVILHPGQPWRGS